MSKSVSDLMSTDLVTATVPGTRAEVLEKIHTENVSCVPVTDRDGALVGIVTRSDLLRGAEEEQIAMIMTRDPETTSPSDPVENAVRSLVDRGIRRLPVVEDDELVGMLSVADLVGEVDSDDPISEYFTPRVTGVWEETPIPLAAMVMQMGGDDAAIIMDDEGSLRGVLSDTDLLRAASIDDYVKTNNMGSGEEDDDWTWEGFKDNIMIYHGVSKIDFPDGLAGDIMTTDIVTKYVKSAAEDAAGDMVENEIEQIPVINEDSEAVGLLRDRDLIKLLI